MWNQADPVSAVTWCPRLHATGLGPFDQLSPVLAGHLFSEAAHEHAPATAGLLINVIDLEGHVRVVRRGKLRASVCAYRDHAGLIEGVVHRKDEGIMLGVDAQTPYLLRSQQLIAVVSAEHPQLRTVFTCCHQQPSFA